MKQPLLSRISNDAVFSCLAFMCYAKAVLAEGTNANTFRATNPFSFTIDGIMYTRAAIDNVAFSTTNLAVHGPSQRRIYLVQIDADGNLTTKQGAPFGEIPSPGGGNDNGVPYVQAQGAITGISNAYMPRVTSAAHGRQTGDTVQMQGIVGPSILNGQTYTVRRVDANNYDLLNVDGRQLPPYQGGGFWTEMELARTAVGAIVVETNAVTTFTPGSVDLSAAGITASYMDFAMVPAIRRQ
ncbi:MAG: hypothetical protein K2W80_14120 [Burkholderiales bacterium]|nr:hypothetical protein [Burkholderiales bacterium]